MSQTIRPNFENMGLRDPFSVALEPQNTEVPSPCVSPPSNEELLSAPVYTCSNVQSPSQRVCSLILETQKLISMQSVLRSSGDVSGANECIERICRNFSNVVSDLLGDRALSFLLDNDFACLPKSFTSSQSRQALALLSRFVAKKPFFKDVDYQRIFVSHMNSVNSPVATWVLHVLPQNTCFSECRDRHRDVFDQGVFKLTDCLEKLELAYEQGQTPEVVSDCINKVAVALADILTSLRNRGRYLGYFTSLLMQVLSNYKRVLSIDGVDTQLKAAVMSNSYVNWFFTKSYLYFFGTDGSTKSLAQRLRENKENSTLLSALTPPNKTNKRVG